MDLAECAEQADSLLGGLGANWPTDDADLQPLENKASDATLLTRSPSSGLLLCEHEDALETLGGSSLSSS